MNGGRGRSVCARVSTESTVKSAFANLAASAAAPSSSSSATSASGASWPDVGTKSRPLARRRPSIRASVAGNWPLPFPPVASFANMPWTSQ